MKIVVKIGSSTLTHSGGRINLRRIGELARTVSDIKNAGHDVILVSSGAIAVGVSKLRLNKRPEDIAGKQAAAAVGQCELMYIYDKEFDLYNHTVAQILLTAPDLKCEDRHKKFENTMSKLIELDTIPIINENDTVATEEIEFGDNDTLAAYVAESVSADLLVLFSDIEGLYTCDPRNNSDATLIEDVYEINEEIMALGGGAGSSVGTGGMITKLRAAKIATDAGCDMIITNGERPERLYDILDGKKTGTRFHSKKQEK